MKMEISSLANFIVHIVRLSEKISEEQLKYLNMNINHSLLKQYTNKWDNKNPSHYRDFRKITLEYGSIDSKLVNPIKHSHFDLSIFATYVRIKTEFIINPGEVFAIVENKMFYIFHYMGPPIPWNIEIKDNTKVSKNEEGVTDYLYRYFMFSKNTNLHFYNGEKYPTNTLHALAKHICQSLYFG